jgi:hypothetical protein
MTNPDWRGSHFCGIYVVGSDRSGPAQEFTPVREKVEDVIADLADAHRRIAGLQSAQIIDLETLEPIEPVSATMARLESAAAA